MDVLSVPCWEPALLVELLEFLHYVMSVEEVQLVLFNFVEDVVYFVDNYTVEVVEELARVGYLRLLQIRGYWLRGAKPGFDRVFSELLVFLFYDEVFYKLESKYFLAVLVLCVVQSVFRLQ